MNGQYDVIVVGAGITGLLLTTQLARGGMSVLLVEQAERALAGATHRNEGWLHAGTYHSVSVAGRAEARTVVNRCKYGWERIVRDYPAAVVPNTDNAVVVVGDATVDVALDRWRDFEVSHKPLANADLRELRKSVRIRPDEQVFEVSDKSIDTRVLARIALADIARLGGDVAFNARLTGFDGEIVQLGSRRVKCGRLVLAAGYNMRAVCSSIGVDSPQIRFWQAHLAVTRQLAPRSVFWVEPDEPASANHRGWTITGGTGVAEDAYPVDEPSLTPRDEGVAALTNNIKKRFVNFDEANSNIVSCVKVDTFGAPSDARSLNVFIAWLTDNVVSILPGKMTEAPFVTDVLASELLGLTSASNVTPRPLDVVRAVSVA